MMLLAAVAAVCGPPSGAGSGSFACPAMRSVNPIKAAATAASHGDCHLYVIGGSSGSAPGASASRLPRRMIAGTGGDSGDVGCAPCDVDRSAAEAWARDYNQVTLSLAGQLSSRCAGR